MLYLSLVLNLPMVRWFRVVALMVHDYLVMRRNAIQETLVQLERILNFCFFIIAFFDRSGISVETQHR